MLSCFVYKHFYVSVRIVYWGCPVSTIIHCFISNNSTITHLTGIFWSPLSTGKALDSLEDTVSQLRRYSFAVKFLSYLLSEHYLPQETFKRVFIFLFLKKKKKKDKKIFTLSVTPHLQTPYLQKHSPVWSHTMTTHYLPFPHCLGSLVPFSRPICRSLGHKYCHLDIKSLRTYSNRTVTTKIFFL